MDQKYLRTFRGAVRTALQTARIRRQHYNDWDLRTWCLKLTAPFDEIAYIALLAPTPAEYWEARRQRRLSELDSDIPF